MLKLIGFMLALALLGGCATNSGRDVLLKDMRTEVAKLQKFMANQSIEIENMKNDLTILRASMGAVDFEGVVVPNHLEVQTLVPPGLSPQILSQASPSAPIVIRIDGSKAPLRKAYDAVAENARATKLAVVVTPPPPNMGAAEHAEKPVLSPLEKQAFGRALVHYRSGEFGAAAKLLEALIEGFPESGNLSNVYYWLAESYSELKENGKALAKYETMLAKYPKAPKKADALLKLAGIYHRVSRPDKAQEIYRDLVIRFPNSAYAKIAQRHLVSGDKGGSVP